MSKNIQFGPERDARLRSMPDDGIPIFGSGIVTAVVTGTVVSIFSITVPVNCRGCRLCYFTYQANSASINAGFQWWKNGAQMAHPYGRIFSGIATTPNIIPVYIIGSPNDEFTLFFENNSGGNRDVAAYASGWTI